ncbi:MAG TPA: peptide ABC transporter substrate-binding protein [Anaerolineaceae bacterium]|nr:peptide ABC transporter substrate-binding protein [Anaerolineaceae bacterium]
MRKFRWQLLIILLTGLVVGLLLVFQQGTNLPEAQNIPSPVTGGIYTEALVGNFLRLNPILDMVNQADKDVDRLLFNGLVRFDSSGMPQPDLAETWSYSSDGTRFTFSLRANAYWHDGRPVTTQDVVYTMGLLREENELIPPDLRAFWSEIQVTALSDTIVEFALPEAFSPLLDYLSVPLLPSHLLGNLTLAELVDHPFNTAPIGTGPYKFNRFLVKDGLVSGVDLLANQDYYLGRPYIDEVVFQYYPSMRAAWTAFQGGEVDGLGGVSNDILPEVLAEPGLNLFSTREPRLSMVFLNLNNSAKDFLQDPEFRQALMLSINRQAILDKVLLGQGVLAHGPILPGSWAYYADQGSYSFDPDLAAQKIAALGITRSEAGTLTTAEGVEVRIILLTPDDELHMQIADSIKQGWESVGVAVDVLSMPYADVIARLDARDFDAALVEIDLSGTPDPDPYPFWAQSQAQSGQNYSQWNNRSASEYLEQARVSNDYNLRTKLYRNYQILFHDQLPSLPLFYPVYNYAIRDTILNVTIGPIYEASDRLNAINTWFILAGNAPEGE